MKKVLSVTIIFLMLAAMLHFSIASHYCNGRISTSVVSFSGKLATCGMENDEQKLPFNGASVSKHCCDNYLVYCGVNGNYFPSFTFVPESFQSHFQVIYAPVSLNIILQDSDKSLYSNVSPPDAKASSNVDLSNICIFRI